jgi:DNA modification methylase
LIPTHHFSIQYAALYISSQQFCHMVCQKCGKYICVFITISAQYNLILFTGSYRKDFQKPWAYENKVLLKETQTSFVEIYLLRYNTMQSIESQPTFQRNNSHPTSVLTSKSSKKPAWSMRQACSACYWFLAWLILWPWRGTPYIPL